MKIAKNVGLIFLLLISGNSFSQVDSGASLYESPEIIVSGVDFDSITGCWAKLYDREGFAGNSLQLVGYTTWADIKQGSFQAWSQNIRSVEVGPDARMVLYGSPNFTDEDHVISSGVSAASLPESPGGEEIQSIKLLCNPN